MAGDREGHPRKDLVGDDGLGIVPAQLLGWSRDLVAVLGGLARHGVMGRCDLLVRPAMDGATMLIPKRALPICPHAATWSRNLSHPVGTVGGVL